MDLVGRNCRECVTSVAWGGTVRSTLSRLRRLFFDKTETAYTERDEASHDSREEAYAEGEAHAYGDAESAVRRAEEAE